MDDDDHMMVPFPKQEPGTTTLWLMGIRDGKKYLREIDLEELDSPTFGDVLHQVALNAARVLEAIDES